MVRVLLVDDERGVRVAERLLLEELGYEVEEAADGERALALLGAAAAAPAAAPRVVVLDYLLPRLDGGGVLRAVAAEPALAATHAFVLVTGVRGMGTAPPAALAPLLAALDVPLLGKPFDSDTFVAAIAQAARRLEHGR